MESSHHFRILNFVLDNPFSGARSLESDGVPLTPYMVCNHVITELMARKASLMVVHGAPGSGVEGMGQRLIKGLAHGLEPLLLQAPESNAVSERERISDPHLIDAYSRSLLIGQQFLGVVNKALWEEGERVVVIDNAHAIANLHLQLLLRDLDRHKLEDRLTALVLLGSPALVAKLEEVNGKADNQYHWCSFDLGAASTDEVTGFVTSHLEKLPDDQELVFSDEAIRAVVHFCGRNLAWVNNLAGWAVVLAARDSASKIDAALIEEAAKHSGLQAESAKPVPFPAGDAALEFLQNGSVSIPAERSDGEAPPRKSTTPSKGSAQDPAEGEAETNPKLKLDAGEGDVATDPRLRIDSEGHESGSEVAHVAASAGDRTRIWSSETPDSADSSLTGERSLRQEVVADGRGGGRGPEVQSSQVAAAGDLDTNGGLPGRPCGLKRTPDENRAEPTRLAQTPSPGLAGNGNVTLLVEAARRREARDGLRRHVRSPSELRGERTPDDVVVSDAHEEEREDDWVRVAKTHIDRGPILGIPDSDSVLDDEPAERSEMSYGAAPRQTARSKQVPLIWLVTGVSFAIGVLAFMWLPAERKSGPETNVSLAVPAAGPGLETSPAEIEIQGGEGSDNAGAHGKAMIDRPGMVSSNPEPNNGTTPDVDRLMKLAEQQLAAKRLTTPVGDNALETFRSVLHLRPRYPQALEGLVRIRKQYDVWAATAATRSEWDNVRRYQERARAVGQEYARHRAAQGGILFWAGCGVTKKAFMLELAEAFERSTGTKVILEGGGATRGIRDTANALVDMGGACRMALPLEDPSEMHVTLHPVAWDALTVIVNPRNPVDNVTSDQIRDIYLGKVKNWRELGGLDAPIHLCVRQGNLSGVGFAIRQYLFQDRNVKFVADRSFVFPSSGPLEEAVERDAFAIGITGVSSARKRDVKIVAVDGGVPTYENMVQGTYRFYRPLYLITRERPTGKAKEFVDFALSAEGQDVIRDSGTVPYLDAPQLAAKTLVHGFGLK